MMRRVVVLFAFALFTVTATARAQQPREIRAELPEDAKKAWDSAQHLASGGDNAGAFVEFLRAYALSKNPRVLFNVAVTERLQGHYARATMWWQRELAEGETKLTPNEVAEIKNAIRVAAQYVTTLTLTSNEAGATLFIDDYEIQGRTPFARPIPIDHGEHTLRLTKPAFVSAIKKVVVVKDQPVTETLDLVKEHPTTRVSIKVQGAPNELVTITMDGKELGHPPIDAEVAVDRHTFTASATGYDDVPITRDLASGTPLDLTITMSEKRHQAKLEIDVSPAGASIEIDDAIVGSDHYAGVLAAGERGRGAHAIVVKKPGYVTQTRDINLLDDETRRLTVTLQEEKLSKSFIWWTVGTIAVVTGGAVAAYFVFRANGAEAYNGTISPGTVQLHRW